MTLDPITRSQAGVFSRVQALASGLTERQVDLRLEAGTWLRLLPSVYALTGVSLGWTSWAWAGLLSAGPAAVVVADSAAVQWRWQPERWPVCIAVPPDRRPRWATGRLCALRLDLGADETTAVDGLPVTTRLRTAVDLAHLVPAARAQPLIDRALLLGAVDRDEWSNAIAQSRRNGSRQARMLARSAADRAASQAERVAHTVLRRAQITGWGANVAVVAGGLRLIVDIAFVAERVAVEIEGWAFHSSPEKRARDEARRAALQLEGWIVLTFAWWDVTQRPGYVVATVRRALDSRLAA